MDAADKQHIQEVTFQLRGLVDELSRALFQQLQGYSIVLKCRIYKSGRPMGDGEERRSRIGESLHLHYPIGN